MSVSLCPTSGAFYQAFTAGGIPLNAGLIYTYQAGGTTPEATYTTSTGGVANANPIVLGADGRPPSEIWLTDGTAYRFDLKDSAGSLIKTYDNVQGIPSSIAIRKDGGTVTTAVIPFALGISLAGGSTLANYVSQTTFTPTLIGQTTPGTQTYSAQSGLYTRIGSIVYFWITVSITAKDGAMAGNLLIGGLPIIASASANYAVTIGTVTGMTLDAGYTQHAARISGGGQQILIYEVGSNNTGVQNTVPNLAATSSFQVSGHYAV